MTRKRLWTLVVTAAVATAVGVWWWQWSAPYRTLTAFMDALYAGNITTLHALTPTHEQKLAGVTPQLVEKTYRQFLKPLLEQRFPHERLMRIQRQNSGHRREVLFYLWFQGEQHPLVVYLCRPPDRQGWRVPFSYFVWLTAKGEYGRATPIMRQLGYEKVATTDGGVFLLQD